MGKIGGKRPGAGRPKGSRNKRDEAIRLAAAKARETPLEYMLRIMSDPKTTAPRADKMALAAAPYVHARLTVTQHSGADGGPIKVKLESAKVDLGQKLSGLRERMKQAAEGTAQIATDIVVDTPATDPIGSATSGDESGLRTGIPIEPH